MLASFPHPSMNFTSSIAPNNPWWMGEKYDGVRCCWHPGNKLLYPYHTFGSLFQFIYARYTRAGLVLRLPKFFKIKSEVFFDGEIWYYNYNLKYETHIIYRFGKGSFLESQKIVTSDENLDWSHLRYIRKLL